MTDRSPQSFADVFNAELEEIAKRQGKDSAEEVDRKELAGLALSGGGIRSATSSLGVLQALRELGVLRIFDYLSTVSGGGFAGSWWSAWTSRNFDASATKDDKFFPPNERIQPERDAQFEESFLEKLREPKHATKTRADVDPVHHLRLFSNYLTPIKGLLSADTWRVVTVISRNLALTWLVLIPILFAAVLIAQAYFTLQPNSETEFLYPYSHQNEDRILNEKISRGMRLIASMDRIVHNDTTEANGLNKLLTTRHKEPLRNAANHDLSLIALFGLDLDSLRMDGRSDSALAANLHQSRTFALLKCEVDSIAQGVFEWRALDSAEHIAHASEQAKLDQEVHAVRAAIDKKVDTMGAQLDAMEAALIKHRWQTRDGWLFNETHLAYLGNRFVLVSYPIIAMIGWIAMFVFLWMINGSNRPFGGNVLQGAYAFVLGLLVFWGFLYMVPGIFGHNEHPEFAADTLAIASSAWAAIALLLLNRVIWDEAHWYWKQHGSRTSPESSQQFAKLLELRRARIVGSHEKLMLAIFLTAMLLGFGGFGHEIINYMLLFESSDSSTQAWQWFARIVSMLTVLSALAGSSALAKKAAPTGDAQVRAPKANNRKLMRTLIALAPPLILLILLCSVSWVSHWVLQEVVFRTEDTTDRLLITIVCCTWLFGGISVYYAIRDMRFRSHQRGIRIALTTYLTFPPLAIVAALLNLKPFFSRFTWLAIPVSVAVWAIIFWKYRVEDYTARHEGESSDKKDTKSFRLPSRFRVFSIAGFTTMVIAVLSFTVVWAGQVLLHEARLPFTWPYIAGLSASLLVLMADLFWGLRQPVYGLGSNHEARLLVGLNVTLCTVFLFVPSLSEDPHFGVTHVLAILIFVAMGLVIFIGWRLDPNALSIHAFYRSRLVRAYLGASNWLRGHTSISDVHPEDDVPMMALANCESGAPYHIVNTTMNLQGTSSLETAQRRASNFILSKRYCGSITTGYRPTEDYMSGEMTLGTAVAVSGAAASPNMGSMQVSGAVTMLMSLLNIRLGYWAPNPSRARWREAQPRLWPYYLVQETLSRTTGFGAYCYLTDGGHFDNTGLYALIERGCRYIVVCDNGADPDTHFNDIGNAIRRARIDFGAEFSINGLTEMTGFGSTATAKSAMKHCLRGTVKYNDQHLKRLWGENWDKNLTPEDREKYRTASIVILKPIIIGDEPSDVLQYGLEYSDFPQQSTANQWFTEDQFESYRRLGHWTAQTAYENLDQAFYGNETFLARIQQPTTKPVEAETRSVEADQMAYGSATVPTIDGSAVETSASSN